MTGRQRDRAAYPWLPAWLERRAKRVQSGRDILGMLADLDRSIAVREGTTKGGEQSAPAGRARIRDESGTPCRDVTATDRETRGGRPGGKPRYWRIETVDGDYRGVPCQKDDLLAFRVDATTGDVALASGEPSGWLTDHMRTTLLRKAANGWASRSTRRAE